MNINKTFSMTRTICRRFMTKLNKTTTTNVNKETRKDDSLEKPSDE